MSTLEKFKALLAEMEAEPIATPADVKVRADLLRGMRNAVEEAGDRLDNAAKGVVNEMSPLHAKLTKIETAPPRSRWGTPLYHGLLGATAKLHAKYAEPSLACNECGYEPRYTGDNTQLAVGILWREAEFERDSQACLHLVLKATGGSK